MRRAQRDSAQSARLEAGTHGYASQVIVGAAGHGASKYHHDKTWKR